MGFFNNKNIFGINGLAPNSQYDAEQRSSPVPSPGYVTPPPGATTPPPGYVTPPPGATTPPPGYVTPPPGATTPPPGYVTPPPGAAHSTSAHEEPQGNHDGKQPCLDSEWLVSIYDSLSAALSLNALQSCMNQKNRATCDTLLLAIMDLLTNLKLVVSSEFSIVGKVGYLLSEALSNIEFLTERTKRYSWWQRQYNDVGKQMIIELSTIRAILSSLYGFSFNTYCKIEWHQNQFYQVMIDLYSDMQKDYLLTLILARCNNSQVPAEIGNWMREYYYTEVLPTPGPIPAGAAVELLQSPSSISVGTTGFF